MFDFGPNPPFEWSASRAALFNYCPRKYYYKYYGSWMGWDRTADERTKLIYLLKNRTSLAGWAGQEVHRGISLYLSSDRLMDSILDVIQGEMRAQFDRSRRKEFMQPGKAKVFGFVEHFYDEGIEDREVIERWEQVEMCLRAFEKTDFREAYKDAAREGRLNYVENPESPDYDAMKIHNHGAGSWPIYASPDFIIERSAGSIEVIDWKTGRMQKIEEVEAITPQLALYVLWMREKMSLSSEKLYDVETFEYYLPKCDVVGGRVTEDSLDQAICIMRDSAEKICELLEESQQNKAYEEDFPCKNAALKCNMCEFRMVCSAASSM